MSLSNIGITTKPTYPHFLITRIFIYSFYIVSEKDYYYNILINLFNNL